MADLRRGATVTAAEPATVRCWGEGEGERRCPDVLRIMIGGQEAGPVGYVKRGVWVARCRTRGGDVSRTEHSNAEKAVNVVVRSGWARRLVGCQKSAWPVSCSDD